jgi:hypothetical protein
MPEKAPSKDDDLIDILKLRTKISTDNMHLYDTDGEIQKFNSAKESK